MGEEGGECRGFGKGKEGGGRKVRLVDEGGEDVLEEI